jgi:transcriptional regulator with XRE-family HTH domain
MRTTNRPKGNVELGRYLRSVRESRGWSLRNLEQRCGLSNAYLSQLENGRVRQPSPDALQRLADALGLEFQQLMRRAGYLASLEAKQARDSSPSHGATCTFGTLQLSQHEEEALLEYLAFLRFRSRRA